MFSITCGFPVVQFCPKLVQKFQQTACRSLPQLPHAMETPPQAQPDRGTNDSSWRVRWQRLNGFVCDHWLGPPLTS